MNRLLAMSGKQLAELIRTGKVSSREAVEAHIERIQEVNPAINAVVKDRFEEARGEADTADRRRKAVKGKGLPPYHGVPFTVKEAYAVKGMPQTGGMVERKDFISQNDATVVTRMKKAGAIPLGITNVPELCLWFETYNKVYGRTRNPYNTKRIAGGSSGGEGAIVAAGGSPFGLGSDIGGSIRMPAFFNGVFGHKPTGGMMPGTGHFPEPENEQRRYNTYGVLARRAEDLMPLVSILAGPDGRDDSCVKFRLGNPASVSMKGLPVLYVDTNGLVPPSRELRAAQRRCADALEKKGARIREARVSLLRGSLPIWTSMIQAANDTSFGVMLGNGRKVNPILEFMKMAAGRSTHTLPAVFLVFLENLNGLAPGLTKKFVSLGKRLRDVMTSMMDERGILLYPSYPTVAPVHNKPLLTPWNFAYTAVLNILEIPVTQVPLGLNEKGLPLGVQVAALHGNDHITIAVAGELEHEFGGWVPPWEAGK